MALPVLRLFVPALKNMSDFILPLIIFQGIDALTPARLRSALVRGDFLRLTITG